MTNMDEPFKSAYDERIAANPSEGHPERKAFVDGYIAGWDAALDVLKHGRDATAARLQEWAEKNA